MHLFCFKCLFDYESLLCFEQNENCQEQYWIVMSLMLMWRSESVCELWSLKFFSESAWYCTSFVFVLFLFDNQNTYCCELYVDLCSLHTFIFLDFWRNNSQIYVFQHSCHIFVVHCIEHLCNHIYDIESISEFNKLYHTVLSFCIWSFKLDLSAESNWSVWHSEISQSWSLQCILKNIIS